MSYDLKLFKKIKNKSIHESADLTLESNLNSLNEKDFQKRKDLLKKELLKLNNEFKIYESKKSLSLEFNKIGLQIGIYPNQISGSIPYWYKEKEFEIILQELYRYLEVIQSHTGYSIYDQQIGKEIDLSENKKESITNYNETTSSLKTIANKIETTLNKNKTVAKPKVNIFSLIKNNFPKISISIETKILFTIIILQIISIFIFLMTKLNDKNIHSFKQLILRITN